MIAILDPQKILAEQLEEVNGAIAAARAAQAAWAQRPIAERARLIGNLRPFFAAEASTIAEITGVVGDRPVAEKLVSEVLPLLDACRFLEQNAARILRPRRHGWRGRPLWLHGSSFQIHRKPFGVVLIVGAGNYPLVIPAVQIVHALVAGNAVVVKPAEGASAAFGQCSRNTPPKSRGSPAPSAHVPWRKRSFRKCCRSSTPAGSSSRTRRAFCGRAGMDRGVARFGFMAARFKFIANRSASC